MTKDLLACPIENTLKLINRKWTIVIIRDMFYGKKHFSEFKDGKDNLSNTVLSNTLKFMENNALIEKKVLNNTSEYYLTKRGRRLNKILYEMASFGLDELECGDEGDEEIIRMFKDYYYDLLKIGESDESGNIE